MGDNRSRSLAPVRALVLLDAKCRSFHERYDHWRSGDRVLGAGPDDARHEPRRHDRREHCPAWLDLLAVVMAAALPIIALGFFGLLIARELTAYRLGHGCPNPLDPSPFPSIRHT